MWTGNKGRQGRPRRDLGGKSDRYREDRAELGDN